MNRKYILAMLTCLMMLSSLAGGLLPSVVQAQLPTPPTITLWGIRTNDPGWGYYGGYWAMWEVIKPALLDIGIDLKIVDLDQFDFEADFYDYWNISGDPNGDGIRDGWDFATREWWLNPTSHIWFDEMVLSTHVPEWNVNPYMDEDADTDYLRAVSALKYDSGSGTYVKDVTSYKTHMSFWQREFMHNPPLIGIYYQEMMTGQAAYFDGYDNIAGWFYGARELRINRTTWDELEDAGEIPSTRLGQGPDAMVVGMSEPVALWHPFYTLYYTEEMVNVLTLGMLYRNEVEYMNFPTHGTPRVFPDLATDYPVWYKASEKYPADYPEDLYPDYMVARIPIRQGVYWSDGVVFNATDVVFTLTNFLDSASGAGARSNYIHFIEEVRESDAYTVDIITNSPRYELDGLFAHGWGLSMLPYHQYVKWGIADDPGAWDLHEGSNGDPIPESAGGTGLERLGPLIPVFSDLKAYPTVVEFERFDYYVGPDGARLDINPDTGAPYPDTPWYWNNTYIDYDLTTPELDGIGDNVGEQWGWALPPDFLLKIIPDGTDRFLALRALEVDLIDYPVASVDDWGLLGPPKHKIYTDGTPYPALHPLWMNLNNPILSNRYVRLAIAYAIPYQQIYEEVLPGWGVANAIPGRTYANPWMEAFDETIPGWSYDIELAKKYMWKYWNSLDETTWSKRTADPYAAVAEDGPMGDHDVSGFVELDDYHLWVERLGTSTSNYEQYIYPYPYPYPTHDQTLYPNSYWPGNDVDPDNDNSDFVELDDFYDWRDNLGEYYP